GRRGGRERRLVHEALADRGGRDQRGSRAPGSLRHDGAPLETFLGFINKVPFYGLAVLCADDPYLAALLPRVTKRYQTYGLTPAADLVGTDVQLHVGVAEFSARLRSEPVGRFKVAMPGIHNVRNALAAIAVGLELGVTLPHIDQALAGFKGVERRFQVLGEKGGVLVVDDYGHHPTEIKATLAAAKNGWGRRLVVLC